MAIIGIDLGTTNSLVGCYKDGKVQLIPNRLGGKLTPSVVCFLNDSLSVGQTAKEVQARTPEVAASAFKRFIGTDKTYMVKDKQLGPVELSSLVLRSLIEDAETYLDEKVERAVISVPAYFNDKQRKSTIEAARLAGIHVDRLINEPTAAAMAYHMHDRKDETVLAIVDLGGGTFDVSVLDIFDSVIEVRAVAGDNYLGGEDFDLAIQRYLISQIGITEDMTTPDLRAQLKYAAEQIKINLSSTGTATIQISHNQNIHDVTVTESKLEELLMPAIEKMKAPLKKAIADSSFGIHNIDEVILVGGSTRMPLVKKFVAKLFGKLPLCRLNPDEVVVRGAVVAAAMKSRNEDFKDTVLTDVCPYTLGTSCLRALPNGSHALQYDPLIERNETIPASIVKRYSNAEDNQREVLIDVYQGESFNLDNNLKLGEIRLPIPRRKKHEVFIDVRFTYDVNGILEVETRVDETGVSEKQIMINANDLSDSEISEKMASLESMKMHPRDQEENHLLVSKGERLFELNKGERRQEIGSELALFVAALNSQKHDDIKRGRVRFKEFLKHMEAL